MSDKSKKSTFFQDFNIVSLILGVVVTFIVTKILDPLLEKIYVSLISLGGSVVSSFSDSVFQDIAKGSCEQGSMFISYVMYIATVFLYFSFMSELFSHYKENIKTLTKIVKKVEEPSSKSTYVDVPETLEEIEQMVDAMSTDLSKLEAELKENRKEISEVAKNTKKKYRNRCLVASLLATLLFITIAFMYAKLNYVNKAITSTTNNIEIVSPYISEEEYKYLKSDFHSIQTHEDFDILRETLDNIAQKHNLILQK